MAWTLSAAYRPGTGGFAWAGIHQKMYSFQPSHLGVFMRLICQRKNNKASKMVFKMGRGIRYAGCRMDDKWGDIAFNERVMSIV
jgi:hypothetical protein